MQLRLRILAKLDSHPANIPPCAIHHLVTQTHELQIEVGTLMERVRPFLQSRDHLEKCWQRIC